MASAAYRAGEKVLAAQMAQRCMNKAQREALANAAKHAGAENMEISFSETQDAVGCAFTSDGRLPAGEVRFTGGLYNLSVLAEKQGAKVRARAGEGFTLSLLFPKKR